MNQLKAEDVKLLRRGRIGADISEKPARELTEDEKRFKKETEWEPETPPGRAEDYIQVRAEDLPEGVKLTILEYKSKDGWDVYEVTEKDPFSVKLIDGQELELGPLDLVEVLRSDIDKTEIKPDTIKESTDMFGMKKPGQQDLFNVPEGQRAAKPKPEKKAKPPPREAQLDLFSGKQNQQIQPELFGDTFPKGKEPKFKPAEETKPPGLQSESWTRMATTGYIGGSGLVVKSPEEVASLLSHIRHFADEISFSVVTDKDGKILEIHRVAEGTKESASINVIEVAGRVLNIPGAHTAYFVHNHPSGEVEASEEDYQMSRILGEILNLRDINFNSFIIGDKTWTGIPEYGLQLEEGEDLKPISRKVKIAVKKRVLMGKKGEKAKTPVATAKVVKDKYKGQEGFLFLGNKLRDS